MTAEILLHHARLHGSISTDEAMALLEVSRATAHRRLKDAVVAGLLEARGAGRGAHYVPAVSHWRFPLKGLEEDKVWRALEPRLRSFGLDTESLGTVGYTVTEMVNNAIDHSGGKVVKLSARVEKDRVIIEVMDDGIGVFERVRMSHGMNSAEDALAQLEKGKLTSQPDRHSGEGIFFSSKAATVFRLEAGTLAWIVDNQARDSSVARLPKAIRGTRVELVFVQGGVPKLADVFRGWTDPESRRFQRTRTTVRLAAMGAQLLSRSEAKRVVAGLERFTEVELDFAGVDLVGQGFCDEIFRVFARAHPQVALEPVRMNESVRFMVERARGR